MIKIPTTPSNKHMNRQIITIGLSDVTNAELGKCVSIVQLVIASCREVSEVARFLKTDACGLIIFDTVSLTSDAIHAALRTLREITYAPILILSSREAAASALEMGADVCVPPDIELRTLFLQGMALIRRYTIYNHQDATDSAAIIRRGDLVIDLHRYRVTQAGSEIRLQRREYRLLALFAKNPGIVLTPDQISEAVWMSEENNNHNVTVAVAELRRKLNDDKNAPTYIETVHGIGYRFLPSE